MKKKTWAIIISAVLVIALAVTGTFAWLTDRDSEVNVFTMGNVDIDLTEDFEQGAVLTPGVKIEKVPTITNTGKNDAWVWMTVAIPAALDNLSGDGQNGSNLNVVHWNCTGATWEGLVAQNYVDSAIAKGLLPAGTTAEQIIAAKTTWNVNNKVAPYQQTINNVSYNVYTLLYNKAITKGESTLPGFIQLFMDATVDIDPDGNLAKVVNGVVTPINWNINTDGAPVVYVSAYATQAEGFADVKAAYDAYQAQWGANSGADYTEPTKVVEVGTAAELQTAVDNAVDGDIIALLCDITGDVKITQKSDVKFTVDGRGNDFNGVMTVFGNGRKLTAGLTIKNINFVAADGAESCIVSPDRAVNNAYSYSSNVTVEGCTFTDPDGVVNCAAVRHQDGGDSNWKIIDCSVDNTMHSLIQTNNVELDGLLIQGCTVKSKNGINLNQCAKVSIVDCEIDVKGYTVRYGVNGATVNGTFEIKDSTLKSANDDGDAVIIFRGNMAGSTLTLTNTTLSGTPEFAGNANVVR